MAENKLERPIIEVRHLSKEYRIGADRSYKLLGETISDIIKNPVRTFHEFSHFYNTFWALKEVNFTLDRGDIVGIIGPNGAGKSTLLKILTRITSPTDGEIILRGRVGSLLEVGTGFHPELTGRENIYFNGAILGMKKKEIDRKFDEIVSFSGIEKFIDTPVKRYSSGMHVRLAFSVAAHLDPEIMMIDEVLAVGDAAFQKKCLGKMEEVASRGRTVLFVSHNMAIIEQLCKKAILIDKGRVIKIGKTSDVIEVYLSMQVNHDKSTKRLFEEQPHKDFQILAATTKNIEHQEVADFYCDHDFLIDFECKVNKTIPGLYGYMEIRKKDGAIVMVSDSFDMGENPLDELNEGYYSLQIQVPKRSLGPGTYDVFINFTSKFHEKSFQVESPGIVCSFDLQDHKSKRGNKRRGHFSTLLPWHVHKKP
ncbi:MAG: ABC transporter ATP-binding protein [Methanoregula sp.]